MSQENRLNIEPSTIYCHDNLEVLQGINSDCIDLIYLDPPFNKKKKFVAPTGTSAEGASFNDIFREEDIKTEMVHAIRQERPQLYNLLNSVSNLPSRYNYCYCVYMAARLIECHRLLKETGSLYLHCDPTMSHYLKLILDCIFSEKNFRNEIIWSYERWTGATKNFQRMHDIVLFYTKTQSNLFNMMTEPYSEKSKHKGKRFSTTDKGKVIEQKYVNKEREKAMRDVWSVSILNSQAKERTGYPTQKPLALLERIIKASSNEGDIVLDPFCGCATTCIAAERLGRKWIGIDISQKAYELVRKRLKKEVPADLLRGEPDFKTSPPKRNADELQAKRYVYIISHNNYPGEYKVGIATDPKSRLSQYQTSDPNRAYKLLYQYETPNFREIEGYIHDKFKARGEWVIADLEDIKQAIQNWQPSQQTLI